MFFPNSFDKSGDYLFYTTKSLDPRLVISEWRGKKRFVARFKRGGKASFLKFLMHNFNEYEYFVRLEAGETPFEILMSKGWVSPMAKKAKKRLMAMMLESKPVRSYDESWVKINGK